MADSIAGAPLDAEAVTFDFDNGFDFVSGVHAPAYMDIRKLFFDPTIRTKVINAFLERIKSEGIVFDVAAGVETGGIAPAALLANALGKQFVYIRKKPKDHGTRRMIEGGEIAGKEVLLIEDTVSTGMSSLSAIEALKTSNAIVKDCITITSYGFPESTASYEKAGIKLHVLTPAADIATEAKNRGLITEKQEQQFISWIKNPYGAW